MVPRAPSRWETGAERIVYISGIGTNGEFDSALRRRVSVTVEALQNLAYLTKLSAEEPLEVRKYTGLAEDRLAELVRFLRG